MPGGLRRLRHVIRPGPARASPPAPLRLAPTSLPRPRRGSPGRGCGGARGGSPGLAPGPRPGEAAARRAPRAPRPGSAAAAPGRPPSPWRVMPREHLLRVTFSSRALGRACALLTRRRSRLEFSLRPPSLGLCLHPAGSQMWQSVVNISWG